MTGIDKDEPMRLHICEWIGDDFTWVAPGPERQLDVGVEAAQVDPYVAEEGALAVPTPAQAPQAAPPAPMTMIQMIQRLEEEVHGLRNCNTPLR
ncbi:hypothetical protein Tco_0461787 [Tanacetum coccineum]